MASSSKKDNFTIAIDAMGGDAAPACTIEGLELAHEKYPDVKFLIFGNESLLSPLLNKYSKIKKVSEIIHTDEVVLSDDKPSIALRQRRHSSMGQAIRAVRKGNAMGIISAGNTGALMAMAKIQLRTLPGIDRPAIGAIIPTKRGNSVMLDLGANVVCDANNLFEFAVMGDAFARSLLGLSSPSIGILNIGTEEMKGNEAVKAASAMLRENGMDLNFHGHIEGDDISAGVVDVIVTDGFSGNIALKTTEGTAKMIASYLKKALTSSLISKAGAFLAKPALAALFKKFDPRLHNGAMFLGLNGVVIKSHGGTDGVGFANAVGVAIELIKHNINEQIIKEMIQSGHIIPEEYADNGEDEEDSE